MVLIGVMLKKLYRKDIKMLQLKKGHKGSAVKRLQELLLNRYPDIITDGVLGSDTQSAIKKIQHEYRLPITGIVDSKTMHVIESENHGDQPVALFKTSIECSSGAIDVFDMRGCHEKPRLATGKFLSVNKITGVTLHQTGCAMGHTPAQWQRLNAHIGLSRRGEIILVNSPETHITHAQGLSQSTIGIEIEGNYPGQTNNRKTWWKPGGGPHHLTAAMLARRSDLFQIINMWFTSKNLKWQHVYAHRQAYAGRVHDPGEEIWKKIAIPWMRKLEQINDEFEYTTFETFDSGKSIPKHWRA